MSGVSLICGYIVCVFLGVLGAIILWMIMTDKIDLSRLLAEANGNASLSRLQLLIFTFVVAVSFFMLAEKGDKLPDVPQGVLTLLGISASTYAVGKGISYSRDEGVTNPDERDKMRTHEQQLAETQLQTARVTHQNPGPPVGPPPAG